jgi:hypothetical protein
MVPFCSNKGSGLTINITSIALQAKRQELEWSLLYDQIEGILNLVVWNVILTRIYIISIQIRNWGDQEDVRECPSI